MLVDRCLQPQRSVGDPVRRQTASAPVSDRRLVYGKRGLLGQFRNKDMPYPAISVEMLDPMLAQGFSDGESVERAVRNLPRAALCVTDG